MSVTGLFIRRPVMTTLIMAGILAFGVMAFRNLPISDLPSVDFPTIQVSAGLPGADPDTMASSVATPLKHEFSTIAGVDSMSSSSLQATQITITFKLDRDIDAAALDVQAAIARAQNRLPRDMPTPPSYRKVNPADQPVLYLALMSDTLPLYSLNEYAETMIAQRISMVDGVALVNVFGSQKYAVRVQVDPQKLAARGIGIDEISRAIQEANVNLPTGTLQGAYQAFTVEASGQLLKAAQYGPIIVAYRNGNPVRLNEIGRVIDSVEIDKTAAWFKPSGTKELKRAIVLAIQRQPGANTVEVVDNVKKLLDTIRMQIPASVAIEPLYDRSIPVRASIEDVEFTLVLTLGLVILVIFLFLRKLRATLIPSVAIPMSIVGTFVIMYLLNYSLDNLSLMALTLSIGFVVDDAIVVLENIVRKMEHGMRPMEAALEGSAEISFTVISMTLSLAAVFIPVLFMPGLLGRLLSEFAVTIGASILVSGVVSLTLTPMMASRFLRVPGQERHGPFYRAIEGVFNGMLWLYEVTLRWVFRHRLITMGVSAGVLAATVYLFLSIPTGFLPSEDAGQIRMQTEAAEGISFESMVAHQLEMAKVVAEQPGIESFMCSAGARGQWASNSGMFSMRLKPRNERKSADEIVQELRPKLARVPGIQGYPQVPPPIQLGGRMTKTLYQYTLQGPDTDELYKYAGLLEQKMRELPGLQDVNTDLLLKNPQVNVDLDRDKASTLGISAEQVELALSCAYGTRQISTMYAPTNQYYVILEVLPQHQRDPAALPLLYMRANSGRLVPLDAIARMSRSTGPLSVNHTGQLPSVTVSFNLKPGYALGTATAEVERLSRELLPATITTSFQGQAQVFQSSQKGLLALLIVSIMVIYLVLGILYESFVHPITILTALPFAGAGALATLMYFKMDLNLYAFVGVIMLIGLVKKNGIMMIDFAIEARRTEGLSARDAMYQACVVRFRPIMMTTMAALVGTLPIALGYGAGAESRRPLGLAVVGGLLFSQSLTLYVTPVFYLYAERMLDLLAQLRGKRRAGDAPVEEHGPAALKPEQGLAEPVVRS